MKLSLYTCHICKKEVRLSVTTDGYKVKVHNRFLNLVECKGSGYRICRESVPAIIKMKAGK